MSIDLESSDHVYCRHQLNKNKIDSSGPERKREYLQKIVLEKETTFKVGEQKIFQEVETLCRVGFYAIGIIKRNSAYDVSFLKIIPAQLLSQRVCSARCDELDDSFSDFLRDKERDIKEHPQAEQLAKFLRELANKIYYAV